MWQKGNVLRLFGREWINTFFGKDWLQRLVNINTIIKKGAPMKLQELLDIYAETVFKPGLGKLKGMTAKLMLRPEAVPRFCKPRPIPYALRPKVEATLEKMEKEGNIEKVEISDWATPVVPVMKPDGSVRICGDNKVTLNPYLQVPQHPIPRAEECFHAVNGGKKFTKLDLAQAYNQIMLDEASKQLTTINTHCGLYRWNRLPFGVASSPAIFQGIMDKVLHGLNHVVWYLDDTLVSGEDDEQHLKNLAEVLYRLEKYGLRGRLSKCQFFQDSVEYLGHEINQEGIQPLEKKVTAIKQAPSPKTVEQLESFLGMINYYGKFIPNLSSIAAPLNQLRHKNRSWQWGSQEETSFQKLKEELVSAKVLVHYNPQLPVKLDCDASSTGIGAVLSHQMLDGTERPIAFASRSLTKAE